MRQTINDDASRPQKEIRKLILVTTAGKVYELLGFKGVLHHLLEISMFCVLSKNCQHFLEEKQCMHLKVNCPRNSRMALTF